MASYPSVATSFVLSEWSDASARSTLQFIAESVAQVAGFGSVVISTVHGDGLVAVAVEGDADLRDTLGELRTTLSDAHADLAMSEDWGRSRFLSHDRSLAGGRDRRPLDIEPVAEPDAWQPLDVLLAPLRAADGELRGLLSVDRPVDGRRPGPAQVTLLARYVAQAEIALLDAIEREELSHRLRLGEAARQVVRVALSRPDFEAALDECKPALLEGFRADDLSIRSYPTEHFSAGGTPRDGVADRCRELLRRMARYCWAHQRVGILTSQWHDSDLLSRDDYLECLAYIQDYGNDSILIAPMGGGRECLGHVIFFRRDANDTWTSDEQTSGFEVAKDVGNAVLASRDLVREQRLVTELRELDTYRTQLLSTVSHELKNPLTAMSGHLELVALDDSLSPDTQSSIAAMERATGRISRVVDDLLTLARLDDPERRVTAADLDLRAPIRAATESTVLLAQHHQVTVEVDTPPGRLPVSGDHEGLERVITNLLSNAMKYSTRGGAVALRVTYRVTAEGGTVASTPAQGHEVELAVVDQGIGISATDQTRLFTEFFRSTNPEALARPGTGLGLAISARIVRGYGGRIEVESTLGQGSTFRVVLPVA